MSDKLTILWGKSIKRTRVFYKGVELQCLTPVTGVEIKDRENIKYSDGWKFYGKQTTN